MSGRLVSAVLEPALPSSLKPYATAVASFATDDGARVYPTIARLAKMVGRRRQATQRAIVELRARKLLEQVTPAGPHQAPHCQFAVAALPHAAQAHK